MTKETKYIKDFKILDLDLEALHELPLDQEFPLFVRVEGVDAQAAILGRDPQTNDVIAKVCMIYDTGDELIEEPLIQIPSEVARGKITEYID
jgi:hypothetical protein